MDNFRQRYISRPLFNKMRAVMPSVSDTEQQALDAGDVWWDAQVLSGKPQWSELTRISK